MPDTEAPKSSGIRPAVPGSQIERSRIAAVPDPQNEIIPRTPRAGKVRRRTIPEIKPVTATPQPRPAEPAPVRPVAVEPQRIEAAAKEATEKGAAEKAKLATEAAEAAARLSAVKNELAAAISQTSSIKRSQRRDRITGIAVAILLAAFIAFQHLPASGVRAQATLPSRAQQTPLVSEARLVKERAPMTLARSLDRLNFVIASAGRRPQDVLLAVRAAGGADRCPFVWTDGQVSLIYRSGMSMMSVTDTLSRCAEAVELLPTDRMR